MDLKKLFNPSSIAIVGVSHEPQKVGHLVAKNLFGQGYKGDQYFINNTYKGTILGQKVYTNLSATCQVAKGAPELAVLAVPADVALLYLDEMAKLKIKYAVIYAAGFKEIGGEGLKREAELIQKAHKYGITILGPNCIGYVNTDKNINLTFLKHVVPSGNIGFISQSGALASMLVDHYVAHRNLGFSSIISLGNKTVVDESDCLEYLYDDKSTDVIAMYLENIADGKKFKEIIQKITKTKPVVILKSGTTQEGSKAALSHTGGLVGDDQVYDAVFKEYGVIRATNMTEFLTILKILSFKKAPSSNRVLVLSNAGGIGVLLADELIKNNLELITISEKTRKDIEKRMGETHKITIHNPIDILGDAGSFDYKQVIEATSKEKNIGSIMVLLTPQANTEIAKTAQVIADAQKRFPKPIYPLFMGEESIEGSHLFFEERKIASFYKYDYLSQSLAKILRWKEHVKQKGSAELPHLLKLSLIANEGEIKNLLNVTEKKQFLNVIDSLDLLRFVDIPVAQYYFVKKDADVKKLAHSIGFPCVVKIISDTIVHKTEVGGVKTNIKTIEELTITIEQMKKRFTLRSIATKGLLVQKMVKGYEMFIGAKRDSNFGIVLVAGLGGIYAELLKEVSERIYPFSYEEFLYMISETKLSKLIRGFRGSGPIDAQKLYEVVMKLGLITEKFNEIKEIDLNPLMISEKEITAVDCRVIL